MDVKVVMSADSTDEGAQTHQWCAGHPEVA